MADKTTTKTTKKQDPEARAVGGIPVKSNVEIRQERAAEAAKQAKKKKEDPAGKKEK
jgi:hypothetical protein